jgi:adhesin/invasin
VWLLPVLALVATVACDKVPLTSPTGSTITLTVSQTTVPINGTIEVIAAVIEAGGTAVHDGTSVIFTGGLGSFTPIEAQTVGGLARSFFKGSTSGTVKIGAFSGAAKATEVEVKVGTAAATTIGISATPSSVSQSGGTVTVSAQVFDASGNALSGVNVTFSADAGQLSATTALTDASGVARTQLTTFQTAKVTATAGAATKDVTVTATSAPTITITAPDTGTVDVPVAITVAVTSGPTTAPRQVQSLTVDFGDGTSETRANVTGSVGFTHSYRQARGFTITATAVDVSGNTGVASDSIVIARQQLPSTSISTAATGTTTTPQAITTTASTTAPNAQIVNVRVTLQDGTVISNATSQGTFNYTFGTAGTYTLTVVATDSNGNTATAQTQTKIS